MEELKGCCGERGLRRKKPATCGQHLHPRHPQSSTVLSTMSPPICLPPAVSLFSMASQRLSLSQHLQTTSF